MSLYSYLVSVQTIYSSKNYPLLSLQPKAMSRREYSPLPTPSSIQKENLAKQTQVNTFNIICLAKISLGEASFKPQLSPELSATVELSGKMCHHGSQHLTEIANMSQGASLCVVLTSQKLFTLARPSSCPPVHIKKKGCSVPTRLTKGHLESGTVERYTSCKQIVQMRAVHSRACMGPQRSQFRSEKQEKYCTITAYLYLSQLLKVAYQCLHCTAVCTKSIVCLA